MSFGVHGQLSAPDHRPDESFPYECIESNSLHYYEMENKSPIPATPFQEAKVAPFIKEPAFNMMFDD